jgi:hypothetical protein
MFFPDELQCQPFGACTKKTVGPCALRCEEKGAGNHEWYLDNNLCLNQDWNKTSELPEYLHLNVVSILVMIQYFGLV